MKRIFVIIISAQLLTSCFKEDVPITGHFNETITIDKSVYTDQSFFDLGTRKVVASNPVDAWDIGFESASAGWHIIINSSRYLGVWPTGTSDFSGTKSVPLNSAWKFDKSDGNPDSTAVGDWLSSGTLGSYNEVYVIGVYDGVRYTPLKKVVFDSVSAGDYKFHYSNIDGSDPADFTLIKDPSANFTYFSFQGGGKQVVIEPDKTGWDIEFTQYSTLLYTQQGVPTPYFVRGVLLNRNGTEAALDSLNKYADISAATVPSLKFSTANDAIGYDWKSVAITGTSADYAIRKNYTYIIRSTGGIYYKLHFTGYYNDQGSPGYPRFEMQVME